jgi:alcohol dehydrogenase
MQQHSLLLHAPRRLGWVAEELPPPGPRELLARTIAGAVSVGAELPQYRGGERGARAPAYPRMTGYESLAEVVACGEQVAEFSPGDRIIAFYGHRSAATVQASRAVPVPGDIPDSLALLAILACDAAKGVAKLGLRSGDAVLIGGAGTMGLLALFNLLARGIRAVDVLEPLPARRRLALALGARAVFEPASSQVPAESYACGVECSSRDAAFAVLQEALAANGRICILADGNLEPLTLTPAFHAKELAVVGSSDGLDYRQYAAWFWDRLRENGTPLAQLFEEHADAQELPRVFERMARGETMPLKVFVRYDPAAPEK